MGLNLLAIVLVAMATVGAIVLLGMYFGSRVAKAFDNVE